MSQFGIDESAARQQLLDLKKLYGAEAVLAALSGAGEEHTELHPEEIERAQEAREVLGDRQTENILDGPIPAAQDVIPDFPPECVDRAERLEQKANDAVKYDDSSELQGGTQLLNNARDDGCISETERTNLKGVLDRLRDDLTPQNRDFFLSELVDAFFAGEVPGPEPTPERDRVSGEKAPVGETQQARVLSTGPGRERQFRFENGVDVPVAVESAVVDALRESLGALVNYIPDGVKLATFEWEPTNGEVVENLWITYDPADNPPGDVDEFKWHGLTTPPAELAEVEDPTMTKVDMSGRGRAGEEGTMMEILRRYSWCGPPVDGLQGVFEPGGDRTPIPDEEMPPGLAQPRPGLISRPGGKFLFTPAGQVVGLNPAAVGDDECIWVEVTQVRRAAGDEEWTVILDVRDEHRAQAPPTVGVDLDIARSSQGLVSAMNTAIAWMERRSPLGVFHEIVDEIERNPEVVVEDPAVEEKMDRMAEKFGGLQPQPGQERLPGTKREATPETRRDLPDEEREFVDRGDREPSHEQSRIVEPTPEEDILELLEGFDARDNIQAIRNTLTALEENDADRAVPSVATHIPDLTEAQRGRLVEQARSLIPQEDRDERSLSEFGVEDDSGRGGRRR